jgi:hypothetical protein
MPGSLSTQTHTVWQGHLITILGAPTHHSVLFTVWSCLPKPCAFVGKASQAPTAKGQLMMVDGTSARARRRSCCGLSILVSSLTPTPLPLHTSLYRLAAGCLSLVCLGRQRRALDQRMRAEPATAATPPTHINNAKRGTRL